MLCCGIPVADAGGGICRLERRVIPEEMSGDSIVVGGLANNEFCPGSVLEDVVGCGRARSDDKVGAATAYGMGSIEVSSFRSSGCQIPMLQCGRTLCRIDLGVFQPCLFLSRATWECLGYAILLAFHQVGRHLSYLAFAMP